MGVLSEGELGALRRETFELVADAAKAALSAARPDPASVTDQVVSLPDIEEPHCPLRLEESGWRSARRSGGPSVRRWN